MNEVMLTDCLSGMAKLDDNSINCIVTSPPYNKTGITGKGKSRGGNQIWGKFNIDYQSYDDDMPEDHYQEWMIEVLNEMTRIIKPDGSIFFNHKPRRHKNRAHLPTDFISRSDAQLYQLIIWNRKSSPNIRKDCLVPCTEHIYWLCKKKPKSFRDAIDRQFISEVWDITAQRQKNHPAPFPQQLVENCILLTTEEQDVILDPFLGSGTTAIVAERLNRQWLGFEIDSQYIDIVNESTGKQPTTFF
jgi:site-specific DNA-methyltransferase (adenine-specific)